MAKAPPRNCLICSNPYTPKTYTQKYCSRACMGEGARLNTPSMRKQQEAIEKLAMLSKGNETDSHNSHYVKLVSRDSISDSEGYVNTACGTVPQGGGRFDSGEVEGRENSESGG